MSAEFPPGWRIVPATAHGVHHILAGEANQDSLAYRRLGPGFVVAIADGAGSRPRSALGSRLAVDSACDAATRTMAAPPATVMTAQRGARRFVHAFFEIYQRRLAALTRARPRTEPGEYASTVLAVVAHPPYYAYLGLGDSFLVLQRGTDGAHLVVANDPDDGGATPFLTTAGRADHLRLGIIADPAVTGLALCTDGLAEALLAVDPAVGPRRRYTTPEDFDAFFRIFADRGVLAVELTRHLNSPEVSATSGDDRTMILAVRV